MKTFRAECLDVDLGIQALAPLSVDEALDALLKTPPPSPEKNTARKKTPARGKRRR